MIAAVILCALLIAAGGIVWWLNSTGHDPRILAAYAAARSARFEHGENGGRR